MNRKVKDALTISIAAAFVFVFALWGICKSDDAVSESERRPLKQFPTLNVEEVLSGRFQSNFESYTLDQFPLRDTFRTLKALAVRDLFREKDNNGIYVADGYAAKLDPTLNESSLDHAADRFRYVYETYFKDCDEIWHAGDIGSTELAERFEAMKTFRAVCGNADGGDLGQISLAGKFGQHLRQGRRVVEKGVALAQPELPLFDGQKLFAIANNLSGVCVKHCQRGCVIAGVDAQRIAAHSCSGSASRPCSRATVPSRPLTN